MVGKKFVPKRVSEVVNEKAFGNEIPAIKFEELEDKEIIIEEYKDLNGAFGAFVAIKFEMDGKSMQTTTGGKAIVTQLHKLSEKQELPAIGKLVSRSNIDKSQSYWIFE